jgi:hypothetical protein
MGGPEMGRPPPPVVSPASLHMYMGPSLLRKCANESLCVAAAASARRWQSALDATTHSGCAAGTIKTTYRTWAVPGRSCERALSSFRALCPKRVGRFVLTGYSKSTHRVLQEYSALFAPSGPVGAAVSARHLRGLSRDTFGVPRAIPWDTGRTPDESSPCGKASRFGGLAEDGMRKSPAPNLSIQKRVEHPSGVGTRAEELLSVLSACYDGSDWTRSLG